MRQADADARSFLPKPNIGISLSTGFGTPEPIMPRGFGIGPAQTTRIRQILTDDIVMQARKLP